MTRSALFAAAALVVVMAGAAGAVDIRGNVSLQGRAFPEEPLYPQQSEWGVSAAAEVEFYQAIGRSQSVIFTPFFRYDSEDDRRTHGDIRELYWELVGSSWEVRAGFNRVFWGVTESQHLVDIINQTDLVEDIDGEDKLGQLMLNLSLIRDLGTFDFFVMSGFRERTYPGAEGRLRFPFVIDEDNVLYESSDERWHVDWAVRYFHYIGPLDFGLSHFNGTSRDPELLVVPPPVSGGAPSIRQRYPLINQTGMDAQLTMGGWLWKAELINRSGWGAGRYAAATAGFEYTFVGAFGSVLDVGVISEYLWDERGLNATTPWQNDVFVGTRIALNDVQSSSVLAGAIVDMGNGTTSVLLEAERRMGENWSTALQARGFGQVDQADFLYVLRADSYLQLDVTRHF